MTAERSEFANSENTGNISIAIDGPAGAGKSTIAKEISKRLSITYVDTGAMYRAIGLKAMRMGIDPADARRVVPMLDGTNVSIEYIDGVQHVLLDGEDVSGLIRTEEVSHYASVISTIPEVRKKLVELQRALARVLNVVMDGRDIGTVVLPDAGLKIFLSASAECRAQRRWRQLQEKGIQEPYADVLRELEQRYYDDTHRAIAPLKAAPDAVHIDTSELTLEQSIDAVCAAVRTRFGLEADA